VAPTRRSSPRRLCWTVALFLALGVITAASPSPSGVLPPGDPRSEGEGAGLVGAPILVAGAVLAIGVVTVVGTLAYVRVSRDD
jgi:hypothetical protein